MDDAKANGLDRSQYAALASFRYALRRFLAFSESAANAVGLPTQQHQALLVIAGFDGPDAPTVGTLSERLIIAPHTATELTTRMVQAGLITKVASSQDRRNRSLALTPKAEALLANLSAIHLGELKALGPVMSGAVARLSHDQP